MLPDVSCPLKQLSVRECVILAPFHHPPASRNCSPPPLACCAPQVAAQMSQAPDQALAPGGAWEQAKAHFAGEQLAYIASFAVQASVVFGDRPKEISYRRLWHLPTAQQYDEAYTLQSVANYREMLGEPPAPQARFQRTVMPAVSRKVVCDVRWSNACPCAVGVYSRAAC